MTGISTHVLDTARGKPVNGLAVHLEREKSRGDWHSLGSGRTGPDGRCTGLLPESEKLSPGIYRLIFDTEGYYRAQGVPGFYPLVYVLFTVREAESHYHIPLLLSPYGYTTYRGS
jgi:5-hydroxyisourate hydrolase